MGHGLNSDDIVDEERHGEAIASLKPRKGAGVSARHPRGECGPSRTVRASSPLRGVAVEGKGAKPGGPDAGATAQPFAKAPCARSAASSRSHGSSPPCFAKRERVCPMRQTRQSDLGTAVPRPVPLLKGQSNSAGAPLRARRSKLATRMSTPSHHAALLHIEDGTVAHHKARRNEILN